MSRLAKNPKIHLLALALLCLLGYARTSTRYFVSEDFLILRYLAETPFWESVWLNLTGPLMGISFVGFYRPVSLLLLGLEYLLLGARPAGFLGVHIVFHLINVALLYRLAWHWSESREVAWGCALVFAVYPLHLNTVVFIASFATLFSATFAFASLLFYEECIRREDRKYLVLAVLAFVLALGSYEQAAILPLLAVARELFLARPFTLLVVKAASRRLAIYTLALGPYFLIRIAALGESIGGYSSFRERVIDLGAIDLGRHLISGLIRLAFPVYSYAISPRILLAVGALLALAAAFALRSWIAGRREYGLWLYGSIWIIVTQAPFAFVGVVPGNGRYWYLTSVGLGLLLTSTVSVVIAGLRGKRPELRPERFAGLLATVVAFGYLGLLIHYAGIYAKAGASTERIQQRLEDLREDGFDRVFLSGYPAFLTGPRDTNIAQVFHWGLSDALDEPFSDSGLEVYPLSRMSPSDLYPLLERGDLGPVFRWHQESRTLSRLIPPADPPPSSLSSRLHSSRDSDSEIRFRPMPGFDHRLIFLARGNPGFYPIHDGAEADGWARAAFPAKVLHSMNRLYEGDSFAWIEARDGQGRVEAVSRLYVVESAQ